VKIALAIPRVLEAVPIGDDEKIQVTDRALLANEPITTTFDYVYQVEGDTLTIRAGERSSPAYA
jgi:hypothetical protein